MDRDKIIKNIISAKQFKLKKANLRIYTLYQESLFYHMRDRIQKFTEKHRHGYQDIEFQCDSDCEHFAKVNGIPRVKDGPVHMLSDLVAWANNRQKKIRGVIEINEVVKVEEDLRRAAKRRKISR